MQRADLKPFQAVSGGRASFPADVPRDATQPLERVSMADNVKTVNRADSAGKDQPARQVGGEIAKWVQ